MKTLVLLLLLVVTTSAHAAKIAVTDLAYTDRISGYFHHVNYHHQSSARDSQSEHDGYDSSNHASSSQHSQTDYSEVEKNYSYIEYGELRKFVGDIKGEILKSGDFQLSQAEPYTVKNSEKVYDIISRIKKGAFPHADYVLFGTVSELDFRNEVNPIVGTDSQSNTFSLMLVAEFSLINTRTYQVKAAFSATGEGQDVRIASPGSRVVPSRGKVVSEVSKNLGIDVARQINEQLGAGSYQNAPPENGNGVQEGDVKVYSQ